MVSGAITMSALFFDGTVIGTGRKQSPSLYQPPSNQQPPTKAKFVDLFSDGASTIGLRSDGSTYFWGWRGSTGANRYSAMNNFANVKHVFTGLGWYAVVKTDNTLKTFKESYLSSTSTRPYMPPIENSATATTITARLNQYDAICPFGTYVSTLNNKRSCEPCTTGFRTPNRTTSHVTQECVKCSSGTRVLRSTAAAFCTFCSAGLYADTNKTTSDPCDICQAGRYQNQNQARVTLCTACPANTFIAGTLLLVGGALLFLLMLLFLVIVMAISLYRHLLYLTIFFSFLIHSVDDGDTQVYHDDFNDCKSCASGQLTGGGSSQKMETGAGLCGICEAGKYAMTANNGSLSCELCEIGKYLDVTGETTCKICKIGEHQDVAGSTFCLPCMPGRYQSRSQQANCLACQGGTFANVTKAASCLACPTGYVAKTGQSNCNKCAPGTFENETTQTNCKSCSSGQSRTAEDEPSQCYPCPEGRYQDQTKQSTCLPCIPGMYNDAVGQFKCIACAENTKSFHPASVACNGCEQGQSADVGSAKCTACEAGQAGIGLNGTCEKCEAGLFRSSNMSSDVCRYCPEGYYQNQMSQASCLPCIPGEYQRSACIHIFLLSRFFSYFV